MSQEKISEKLCEMEDDLIDSEDDGNSSGEEEELDIMAKSKCIFCADEFPSPQEVFRHCNDNHDFNIVSMVKQHNFDFYEYIKFINFIRKMTPPPSTLTTSYTLHQSPWTSEDYLIPVVQDDPMLGFDVSCDMETLIPDLFSKSSKTGNSQDQSKSSPQQNITLTFEEMNKLLSDLETSKKQCSIYSNQLDHALGDLDKLRSSSINQSNMTLADLGNSSCNNDNNNGGGGGDDVRRVEDDDYYFQSYDHYGIHEDMLKDTVRTLAYQEAILKNGDLIKDKKVLDLGCGTCILSMFMTEAGAESVYAVDQSDVLYKAMQIVRENNLEGRIHCIKGRIEDVTLPVDKVDVIVSEWMGYFLLFESMLESVLWARTRFLKQNGILMPNKCQIMLGAFEDDAIYQSRVAYWDHVYGYRMAVMREAVLKEAQVDVLKQGAVCAREHCVFDLDLMTCSRRDMDSCHAFILHASRHANVTGFYAYFNTTFDLPHKVVLTTSPQTTPTHWKQTLFLLPKPLPVKKDEVIEGKIWWRRNVKDSRAFIVNIAVAGKMFKYYLS